MIVNLGHLKISSSGHAPPWSLMTTRRYSEFSLIHCWIMRMSSLNWLITWTVFSSYLLF